MALTKTQKKEQIDFGAKKLQESNAVVFAEFKGITVEQFKKLRRELKKADADMKVLKKRLLNIALKNAGVEFDGTKMKNQLSTVFAHGDIASVAALIHKFSKEIVKGKKGEFSVLAAYDVPGKQLVDANEFRAIATLPSREVLLAQIAMMLTMPLKQVMMILSEKAKKSETAAA